jgi:hypothetical protein
MAAMSASLALLSVSGGDGHPDSVLTGHGGNMDGVEVCSIVGAGVESVGRATDAMVKAGSSSLSCSSSSPFFFEIFVHPPAAADAGLVHGVAVDDYIGNFRWLEAAAPNACCKKTCSISGGDFQQIAVGVGGYGFIVSLSGEAGLAYDADS